MDKAIRYARSGNVCRKTVDHFSQYSRARLAGRHPSAAERCSLFAQRVDDVQLRMCPGARRLQKKARNCCGLFYFTRVRSHQL